MEKVSSLALLKDEELLQIYNQAKELRLEHEFLQLLAEEAMRRNIISGMPNSA